MAVLLVDSTVYIDWMRRGHSPVRMLAPYVQSGALASCGLIRAEVIRGVINPAVRSEMEEFFDLIPSVETTAAIWEAVANLAWKLDRKGRVLPLTDLAIAVCAQSIHAEIISHDRHFAGIPGILWRTGLPSAG
ncbi:MAG TPA: PIN domain-containing protein [Kiritimatiellia bacterium]|nr:PIN domain-containing protein [Kiritimatiellia bacterium]